MPPIYSIVYLIWGLTEVILNLKLQSSTGDKKADKNSLRLLWVTILVSIATAVYTSYHLFLPISLWPYISYTGLGVILLGMILRLYSIFSLGRMFTVDVSIRDSHILKQNGIYSILRHPSYTGALLSFIGFGFSLNNWASLLIIILPVTAAFMQRIKIEEKVLMEAFGSDYMAYKKKTKALVPFVF